jgi:hypothetical protein
VPDDREDYREESGTTPFQAIWRNIIILIVLSAGAFIAFISLVYFMHDMIIVDLGYRHFATIFGLPAAAAASLLVVLVTRAVSGPMSVSFLGLNFRGAASEAIMWVICFLAISYALQCTWKLEYTPPNFFQPFSSSGH